MKTLLLFIVASIGMLTNEIPVALICLVLFFLIIYFSGSKEKIEISKESSLNVRNNICDCGDGFCNKYCANK